MEVSPRFVITSSYAASVRHNSLFVTVTLHIFKKWGNIRFASVNAQQSLRDCDSAYLSNGMYHSLRDCGCAYLTKWGNSRFATVTLHI